MNPIAMLLCFMSFSDSAHLLLTVVHMPASYLLALFFLLNSLFLLVLVFAEGCPIKAGWSPFTPPAPPILPAASSYSVPEFGAL